MDHDGHAHPERLLERGRGKSVVNHRRDATRTRHTRHPRDIEHFEHRVARGLEIKQARVRPESLFKVFDARGLDESGRRAHAGQLLVEEIVRRAVEGSGRHHVVAHFDVSHNRGGNRRDPGGGRQRCFSAFERRELLLQRVNRRIAVPGVHEPWFFLPIDFRHFLSAGGGKSCGLINGSVQSAGRRADDFPRVDSKRSELKSVFHFAPQASEWTNGTLSLTCLGEKGKEPVRIKYQETSNGKFRHAVKASWSSADLRSEEHTSELQSPCNLVCRLLLEKKKKTNKINIQMSQKIIMNHEKTV